MKVSIITVCFNSEKTILDTIESVVSQSYKDIEYIIVDGKSSDGTLSIINSYKANIDKLISEPDEGIYDAMNKGIAHATGEIVGILNSDDFYQSPNTISNIVKEVQKRNPIDAVYGDVVYVENDNLNKITRYYSSEHFKAWKLRFGWMPPHPATFIKRSVYEKYGKYDLSYKIAADYEIFVRFLLKEKLAFSRIDKTIVIMRTGGVSTSGLRSSITLNLEIVKSCRNNNIYTNLLLIMIKIPFKLIELIRRPRLES